MMEKNESIKKWDDVAGYFNELRVPSWDDDLFLKTLDRLPVWKGDIQVLDIGCGAGRYSIALADRCGHVTGNDISPEMIAFAERKKEEYGKDNICFLNESWHDIDIRKKGYEKKFDLVFGHMTPALADTYDLEKATQASRGYCAMAAFADRRAPLEDEFRRKMNIETSVQDNDKNAAFFEYLYRQKRFPEVNYYYRDDSQEFDGESAAMFLKNRYAGEIEGDDEDALIKIREFVSRNLKGGIFVNEVNATIVTLVWQAGEGGCRFDGYKR